MHILTLLGSPRKRGNTATVLSMVEHAVGAEHQVERINLIEHDLHGCLGCSACQKRLDEPACAQHDGTLQVLERILAADALVYATPLYSWDYAGQMKLLIDRHFCLTKWEAPDPPLSLMAGKRAALLVTCADPVENNADLLPILFRRQMDCARCTVAGTFVVPNCTTPDRLPAEAQAVAAELARALTAV
jgi:putative NADPH-quinone reductase